MADSVRPAVRNRRRRRPEGDRATLLSRLRLATASAHRRVENHPLLTPLLSDELTPEHYRRVLRCFLNYYQALEQQLPDRLPPAEPAYRYLPRTPLLLRDLQTLGEIPATAVTVPPPLPSLSCPARVLGTLYVIEGSTQGGRLIGPKICRQLDLGPQQGASFFHLFQHAQWKPLRRRFESAAPGFDADAVEAGALETFTTLDQHLDRYYPREENACRIA